MRRHLALASLSRDHHRALVIAHRLCRAATPQAAEVAVSEFLSFWEHECQAHFRQEEEILLPAFIDGGDPRHPAVIQAVIDHMTIRRDTMRLRREVSSTAAVRLGVLLAAHVRLEERVLFPLIEETLDADQLAAVDALLRSSASCR